MEHVVLKPFIKKIKDILEKIASTSVEDFKLDQEASSLIEEIKLNVNNGNIPSSLCFECEYCLDFNMLFTGLFNYVFKRKDHDKKYIKQLLHAFEMATVVDKITKDMQYSKLNQDDFNINTIDINEVKKTKIYFDLNVINHFYMENDEIKDLINKVKKDDFLFVYSPAHLCEFVNMSDENMRVKRLQAIRDLTGCIEILPEGDHLKFVIEDPNYPLNRINKNPKFNYGLEELKLIKDKDRDVYFEVFNDILHKKKVNNEPVLEKYESKINDILLFNGYRYLDEMKNAYTDTDDLDLQKIENDIQALYYVFDMIGYNKDKKEQKIRSSIYDIEHLTYAWSCEMFVTNDQKCYERAKLIYGFLGFKTKVIKADKELKETLSSILMKEV